MQTPEEMKKALEAISKECEKLRQDLQDARKPCAAKVEGFQFAEKMGDSIPIQSGVGPLVQRWKDSTEAERLASYTAWKASQDATPCCHHAEMKESKAQKPV